MHPSELSLRMRFSSLPGGSLRLGAALEGPQDCLNRDIPLSAVSETVNLLRLVHGRTIILWQVVLLCAILGLLAELGS